LLSYFKSIKRIQMAEKEDLIKIIGSNRGSIVYEHFFKKRNAEN